MLKLVFLVTRGAVAIAGDGRVAAAKPTQLNPRQSDRKYRIPAPQFTYLSENP
jgi:hypothetical protein